MTIVFYSVSVFIIYKTIHKIFRPHIETSYVNWVTISFVVNTLLLGGFFLIVALVGFAGLGGASEEYFNRLGSALLIILLVGLTCLIGFFIFIKNLTLLSKFIIAFLIPCVIVVSATLASTVTKRTLNLLESSNRENFVKTVVFGENIILDKVEDKGVFYIKIPFSTTSKFTPYLLFMVFDADIEGIKTSEPLVLRLGDTECEITESNVLFYQVENNSPEHLMGGRSEYSGVTEYSPGPEYKPGSNYWLIKGFVLDPNVGCADVFQEYVKGRKLRIYFRGDYKDELIHSALIN